MSFWKMFSKSDTDNKSTLEHNLKLEFPDFSDEKLIKLASISGLLSVVAFTDLIITENEKAAIRDGLKEWTNLTQEEIDAVSEISQKHAKELIDLENHLYANSLNETMSKDEKYYLIESLFDIAASDNHVSNQESEQIRSISINLKLPRNLFLAARAKVAERLDVLKS
jgi:uncharacterized tellurite resistance protein B-like protein